MSAGVQVAALLHIKLFIVNKDVFTIRSGLLLSQRFSYSFQGARLCLASDSYGLTGGHPAATCGIAFRGTGD